MSEITPVRGVRDQMDSPLQLMIPDILITQAKQRGNQSWLTAIGPNGEQETITFSELEVLSARLAGWLSRRFGVQQGSMVALCPVNCLDSVIAIFALMRSGATTLMLNPADPPERHAQLLEGGGAGLVLRSPLIDPAALPTAVEMPNLRHVDNVPFVQPALQPGQDAFLIGTSGSTAASKIVRQTHGNAAANAADTVAHHRMGPHETFLGCLPIHHVNGLHFTLFATLAAGCHAILLRGFDPLRYPQVMGAVRPRIASVVPSILDVLSGVWRGRALPDGFGYFVSAAAALTSETALAVNTRVGARIVQGYGLSETTNFSCKMPTDLPEAEYRALMIEARIPPVGKALSNEIAILDASGQICAEGTVGELAMRGPNVMAGYHANAEATREAFRHGWFHSGDLGYSIRSRSGERLFILTGRSKNIAKVRGESVSLEEMDRVLRGVPGVQDAACVAQPDKRTGEAIVAAVVATDNVTDATIMERLRKAFPPGVLPSQILRLERIPRTPTGKIQRPRLVAALSAFAQSRRSI